MLRDRIYLYDILMCPWILAAIGCTIIWTIGWKFNLPYPSMSEEGKNIIMQAGITLGSIFAGFDTVLKSTYLTLSTRGLAQLRKSKLNRKVLREILLSLIASLFFIAVCFINILLKMECFQGVRAFIWCFGAIWMVISFFNVHRLIDGHLEE